MQQPPSYTNPQYYQQPQPQPYWNGKHLAGAIILAGSIGVGAMFFLFGFALLLPWCFLPFIAIAGIVGLVMLF
jgi:hypothetical protein